MAGRKSSEANLSRLRSRLRQSGAIMSSRSVASREDAEMDFEVVDVGEGHHPTGVEQLLARLEQHGLRRRLVAEDDASAYAVDVAVCADEEQNNEGSLASENDNNEGGVRAKSCIGEGTSVKIPLSTSSQGTMSRSVSASRHDVEDSARAPYYYLCVPCELRLTRISRCAPPWRVLEDVHFHFSSAAHRSTASWMADDDIDETLRCTPLVEPTSHYSRIFLNGIPTLLSRRPGGGDMFYPLPHEVDAVRPPPRRHEGAGRDAGVLSSCSSIGSAAESTMQTFQLFPPTSARGEGGGCAVLWHRALSSVYTTKVQLLRRTSLPPPVKKPVYQRLPNTKIYRVCRRLARAQVHVHHIDLQAYRALSRLPPSLLPLIPAVLPIHRTRVAKALLTLEEPSSKAIILKTNKQGSSEEDVSTSPEDPHRTLYTQSYIPIAEGWRDFYKQGGGDQTTEPPVPLSVFEEESYRIVLVSAEERRSRQALMPSLAQRESLHDPAAPAVLTRELLTQHTQTMSHAWQSPAGSSVSESMASSSACMLRSRRSSSTARTSLPPNRLHSKAPLGERV